MATDRVTRSKPASNTRNRQLRKSKSNQDQTASMDLDKPETTIEQTKTHHLSGKFNPKELFNTEDEFTSSDDNKSSPSEKSIEEQKTPKPPKKSKKNTLPNLPSENPEEKINELPLPLFNSNILGQWQNSEKFDQHSFNLGRTNQINPSKIGNFQHASSSTNPNRAGDTGEGISRGTDQAPTTGTGPTTQIETRTDNHFWIPFNKVKGDTVLEKHKHIRAEFGNIKGFHNAITQRHIPDHFRLTFTSAQSMEQATNKASTLNMDCTMISPIDTIEIKSRSILVKEIPLGTLKEAIQAHFQDFGSINKITWSVVGL